MFPAKSILKCFMNSIYIYFVLLAIQGQFSINLAGTGVKIASTAKWLAQGTYASVIIHRSQVSSAGQKGSLKYFCAVN